MTINGHIIVMEIVNIATLKAKLSQYLRIVRRGGTVDVVDRSTPIARIVPYQNDAETSVIVPEERGEHLGSLEALLEERQTHR
jgi:prevent-host-death family protein